METEERQEMSETASKLTVCVVNMEHALTNLVLVIVVPANPVIPENTVMKVSF